MQLRGKDSPPTKPGSSSKVMIHNMLASSDCLQRSAMLHSPPNSGMQTPRDSVWVDSKERFSEMATNIRGISNALSSVSLSLKASAIVIIAKLNDQSIRAKLHQLVDWLLRFEGKPDCKVYVQDEFENADDFSANKIVADNPSAKSRLHFWTPELLVQNADKVDLVITLGGDGTVLYTSWLFQQIVPPVLSFSLGSLGFMTENRFEDFEDVVTRHLNNGITCALRMRFHCSVWRNNDSEGVTHDMNSLRLAIEGSIKGGMPENYVKDGEYVILNDVVVDRGPNPIVTLTELYGDHQFLTSIQADGVVISTPTGSTAYSMSAGGSLVHPDVPAILVSPICPHTLSFRPLVLPDSMVLQIGVPYDSRSSAYVSLDGKERIELRKGDFLTINASQYPFPKIMCPQETQATWVQSLGNMLHWNEQRRLKAFT